MIGPFRVPAGCGSMLASPPLPSLSAFVCQAWRESAERRQAWRLAERDAWAEGRRELLAVAEAQTARGDEALALPHDLNAPVLVTGHQPELYPPGVWVKGFIADAVCRTSGVVGVNLTVDSDLASPAVDLPALSDGQWRRARVVLPGIRAGVPWSSQAPLGRDGWRALIDVLRGVLPSALHQVLGDFATCVARARAVREARTLAESLLWARRSWEAQSGPPRYLELPVSAMCDTFAFSAFAASLLTRLPDFWQIHNDCLAAYRRHHRVRSGAHPVPDLRRRDALWETPLWCVHADGTRAGLFAEREATGWRVRSKACSLGQLHDGATEDWPQQLRVMLGRVGAALRPRALTLTMFTRRALADVFLHGVGGARYERLGDEIAARFFGTAPAPWAVASASLCVAGHDGADADDDAETARDVRRRLRDMHHNPQRFALPEDPLAARKRALVAAIADASGPHKRHLNHELDQTDADLRVHIAPARAALVARLANLDAADASRAARHWRGYPFVLFRPEQLRRLVEAALRGP